jgi:hypothetical protein
VKNLVQALFFHTWGNLYLFTARDRFKRNRRAASQKSFIVKLDVSEVGGVMTPPDPQLKGACCPGAFNPCACQVKKPVSKRAFHQMGQLASALLLLQRAFQIHLAPSCFNLQLQMQLAHRYAEDESMCEELESKDGRGIGRRDSNAVRRCTLTDSP